MLELTYLHAQRGSYMHILNEYIHFAISQPKTEMDLSVSMETRRIEENANKYLFALRLFYLPQCNQPTVNLTKSAASCKNMTRYICIYSRKD